MKAVQIMFEEELLAQLDETAEVRQKGRSAVLRELASDFLRRRRAREIDAQYERAYAEVEDRSARTSRDGKNREVPLGRH